MKGRGDAARRPYRRGVRGWYGRDVRRWPKAKLWGLQALRPPESQSFALRRPARQKRGFSVPISRWMRKELRPWLDEALGEERLKRQGIFNTQLVRRLLEEHWAGRADHRKILWALFCFQLWYDRWAG